ncbi:MAG: SDR family oxidoreductase [Burkholderiales bacterium]|nr:SDR family oxidoreductase [Burkholderiales bacterium]
MDAPRVLVTGAAGYLGSQLIAALAADPMRKPAVLVAMDLRELAPEERLADVIYETADIRIPDLGALLKRHAIDTVVHLASIVTPGRQSRREFEYSVDVLGTGNLLRACVAAAVRKIIVSSSGAAYGYHADNPAWISEDAPVRGNREFAYSWHKRLVEEMLADYRVQAPQLAQVVFRIGTVLGETVRNQITDLFDKPRLIAIRGSDSPFVFIWDQDVVGCMLHAVHSEQAGVYNVAGDGAMRIHEIAARLDKRCVVLPAWLLRSALALLKPLGLTQYGPEQVNFLRYRPVLSNRRLKEHFGYVPKKTTTEVFEFYLAARERRGGL